MNSKVIALVAGGAALAIMASSRRKPKVKHHSKTPSERMGLSGKYPSKDELIAWYEAHQKDVDDQSDDINLDDEDDTSHDIEDIEEYEGDDEEDEEDEDDEEEDSGDEEDQIGSDESEESIILKLMDNNGRAMLGSLYRIRHGDSPLELCREALFGSRAPILDELKRLQSKELLVRIYCSPWNQAIYGVDPDMISDDDMAFIVNKIVSFDPIYQDNYNRMINGYPPSAAQGNSYALIWIPMINIDVLDLEGRITTENMNHQDTVHGIGGNMIDPPSEIIAMGLDDSSGGVVGCDLPEGDFRREIHNP